MRDTFCQTKMTRHENPWDLSHTLASNLQFSTLKQLVWEPGALFPGFIADIDLEFLIRLLTGSFVLKNTRVTNLFTWIWKLRDIFVRPWRDLYMCRHGNLRDRSQFSVQPSGLISNIADFHGRRHLEFLIRFLIGSWVLKINYVTDFVTWITSGSLIGREPF